MSHGDKSAYTAKQKREPRHIEARHVEDAYRQRGASSKRAERIAWASVYKQDAGGLKKDY